MTYLLQVDDSELDQLIDDVIGKVEEGTDPEGDNVRKSLLFMAETTEKYWSQVTHRDTATLYRSYLIEIGDAGGRGSANIFIDPHMINPRGQFPAEYGPYEFARGGSHDAIGQAFRYANPRVAVQGIELIIRNIEV